MRLVDPKSYAGFIYIWTNKINGKKYLGSHRGKITDKYMGSGIAFRNAIKKYGADQFKREVLEYVQETDLIQIREQYWLDYYEVSKNPIFYNISGSASGGRTLEGKTVEELKIWKEKCRQGQLNKEWVPSEEQRQKISKKSKESWAKLGRKEKQSNKLKGNKYRNGIKHTEENKLKMKKSQQKRFADPVKRQCFINKHKESRIGRIYSGIKVIIDNIEYPSKRIACDKLHLTRKQLEDKLNNITTASPGDHAKKPVIIDGIVYTSMKEANELTGLSFYKIRNITNGIKKNIQGGPNAQKVVINNIEYKSKSEAMRQLKISYKNLKILLSGGIPNKIGDHARKPIIINGTTYPSLKEAANHLGKNIKTLRRQIKRGLLDGTLINRAGEKAKKPVKINDVSYASIKDALAVLKISRRTFNRYVKSGKIILE